MRNSNQNRTLEQHSRIPHTPFIFIRHGETDWNLRNIAMRQQDIPLNETGIQQAHKAAQILNDIPIVSIISSTLTRTLQTAEIISSPFGIPFQGDDNLREMSFGVIEGQPKGDGSTFKAWRAGEHVEGAETYNDFTSRVVSALRKALHNQGPVLIITHGGVYWPIQETLNLPITDLSNCSPMYHRPPDTHKTPWLVYPVGETKDVVC